MPDDAHGVDRILLEAVLSRLVPDDGHGAGAREVGLLEFILARLAGERQASAATYARGLRDIDERARRRYGHGFAAATDEERDTILSRLEGEEADLPPWEIGGAFFETVLRDMREGMFGDPSHGGNRDAAGWDLLGYPDPRLTWTADDQRLDVVIIPLEPRRARPPQVLR